MARLTDEDPACQVMHDPPHNNELCQDDMRKCFNYRDIHELIRAIYSYYSRSCKKLRGLTAVAEELGEELAKMHYIFEVRMVESETVTLKNFLIDLPVIVVDLQRAIEATVGTAEAQSVLFKFVAVCLPLLDINIILRRFSKGTQADDGVVVDLPLLYDSYRISIAQLAAGSFEPKVQNNLANLRNGKYGSITLQQAPGSTREAANARPPSGTDEAPASSPAGEDQRLLEESYRSS
ncbi:hypothetical protein T492DRAFT_1002501 [Pavlovales sp. CCMP2436]|nr:hypothetical protein T492DRAFT_1002501 [Pavlovales sp. CCMP2436]